MPRVSDGNKMSLMCHDLDTCAEGWSQLFGRMFAIWLGFCILGRNTTARVSTP